MTGRLRFVAVAIGLGIAALVVSGCLGIAGSRTDPRETAATEALQTALDETYLHDQVTGVLAVVEQYAGTDAAAKAPAKAEEILLAGLPNEGERVFDDELPSPAFVSDFGGHVQLADLVAFMDLVPASYDADATRRAAIDLAVKIGGDWTKRIREVGKDRVSWAKTLRSKGTSSGNYDNFSDTEAEDVKFEVQLLKKMDAPEELTAAFGSISKAIHYAGDAAPHASSTKLSGKTFISTYTPSQITKCQRGGEELVRRAGKINDQLDSVQ